MNGGAQWLGAILLPMALLPAPLVGADTARPRILGVAHIAIYAHDYEKSLAFYRDFLGLEEPYSLAKPDGTPSMTFFKINERQYLELFPEAAPKTDRLNHISIETDNAEGMRLYRKRQANLFDPDGTRTELMAPATIDGKPPPPSTAPPPR